jgi:glycosyltransferase involved in cell wall biosynthesis
LLRFRVAYKNLQINPKAHDVVYFYWGDKSVMLAPVIKKKFRCKIAVRFHGSDLYEEAKIGYIPFRQYVLPAIDQLITVSDFGHRYILNEYKSQVSDSKILVSRLGVFDHGVNASQSANPGFFHMVSCSNLVELKRINLIIKALSLISFRVKWTHFGDGPLREELHSLCETLPPNIEANWMGHQSNELVISYYKENYIDLFINVSSSEGIPVSIMEAMSFGIPAMATNVGGVSELVNASNGILLQAGLDENMLANSIISLVKNENKIGLREMR